MNKYLTYHNITLILIQFTIPCLVFGLDSTEISYKKADSLFNKAQMYANDHKDSAVILLSESMKIYSRLNNQHLLAYASLKKSSIYSQTGQYQAAFDLVWDVLATIQDQKYDSLRAEAFCQLAILYELYEQYERSLENNTIAINLLKGITKNQAYNYLKLSKFYHSRGITLKKQGNYKDAISSFEQGLSYLDSAKAPYFYQGYYYSHLGHIQGMQGNWTRGEELLNTAKNILKTHDERSLILIHFFLGDNYAARNDWHEAIKYYLLSLEKLDLLKAHTDIKVEVLENLSNAYREQGDYKLALHYLEESKLLGDSLFGSRSSQNRMLFEIKDSYQAKLNSAEEELGRKRIALLKQKQFMGIIIFILILVIILFYVKYISRKYKSEKQIIEQEKILEIKKGYEVLEIKNKELTSTALRIIEKDKLLNEIKNELIELKKKSQNKQIVDKIVRSIDTDSTRNWQEFELRFTAVHEKFYENLRQKHPILSPTELKMCSFIKLGLSSKEMAHLMGIGITSMHTARSRLRKKLNLNREDNIERYISGL